MAKKKIIIRQNPIKTQREYIKYLYEFEVQGQILMNKKILKMQENWKLKLYNYIVILQY